MNCDMEICEKIRLVRDEISLILAMLNLRYLVNIQNKMSIT